MSGADITVNDVVAFVVEIAAVVALAVWGFRAGSAPVTKALLGVGIPLLAIVLWGLFAAPRSIVDNVVIEVAVKILVLGGAVLASFTLVPVGWAAAFAVVVAVNTLLLYVGPFAR